MGGRSLTSASALARSRAPSRPVIVAIGAAGVVCAVLAALAVDTGPGRSQSTALDVFTVLAGVSFVAVGLVAWSRRVERATGALMVCTGFALFAGVLVSADQSLPFTIGLAAGVIPNALLAHLLLAFPDGRLHSTVERLLVGLAYVTAIVIQTVMLMFMDISNVDGCPCPSNLLFVRDAMDVHAAMMSFERYAGIAIAGGVAVVLARRWESASPLSRRALTPVLLTGGITTALLGCAFIATTPSVELKFQSAAQVMLATIPLAYLFGLFQARLARAGVSDLVVELGRAPERGRLRDALARALRDPTLELGYWRADAGAYADLDGQPVNIAPSAHRAVTLVEHDGRKVAALVHDAALSEDPVLLDAVSSAAGLALENERLLAELRAQLEETRNSRARIVEASVAERRRLERNLHDGAQQRLVTLSLHLRMAQETLRADPPAAEPLLEAVGDELKQALQELRELARGLHPAVLTDRGLLPALQSIANRAPFPVEITGVPAGRLPEAVEAAIYYLVAESLTNAAKHAHAGEAHVELSVGDGSVGVVIRDNGDGGADLTGGSGLRGLADRVAALGGRFTVESPAGAGTVVRADLPLR